MNGRRLLAAAIGAFVLVGAGACGGQPGATLTTAPPTTGSPVTSPPTTAGSEARSVTISRPADGSIVPPGDLQVVVTVSGTDIVDKTGGPPVPGEGHLIYYVGVDFVPTKPGAPAYTAPGTYVTSASLTHTFPAVPAGRHGIAVQVVNNDDTPLVPPLTARATVSVQGDTAPGDTPSAPQAPSASSAEPSPANRRGTPATPAPGANP